MILYVSWGGTGWAASVREAMRRAMTDNVDGDSENGQRGLRYLAVLDDEHFADLDDNMLALVTEELRWLIDAQLELTRRQLGATDLVTEVIVRTGDVADAVVDVTEERGPAEVLIGAPLPAHQTIEALTSEVQARTKVEVSVVTPPS